jgi:hypothetical protein
MKVEKDYRIIVKHRDKHSRLELITNSKRDYVQGRETDKLTDA